MIRGRIVISLFLDSNVGPTVDARCIELGNPGVGGTQFCMLELVHYLNSLDKYVIHLLSVRNYMIEEGVSIHLINGDEEVCSIAEALHTDILITRVPSSQVYKNDISNSSFKVIVWSHNFLSIDSCKYIAKTPQIIVNVFVGKQMYDYYIDDDIIQKSVFIYNMYKDNTPNLIRENDSRTVAFMGSICAGKGFLEMVKMWRRIRNKVPNARLIVLGNGSLYGDARLGSLGIASEAYERKLYPYILDNDGKIIDSIEFLGIIGQEKTDIFRRCSVGVANPSGHRESFGMVVLEMAEAELPVCSYSVAGYNDTIENGVTGYLSKSLYSIADRIVDLLRNPTLNSSFGRNAKEYIKRFSPQVVGPQWDSLINHVYNGDVLIEKNTPSKPLGLNFKWLRVLNSVMRFRLHLSFLPSVSMIESKVIGLLIHFKKLVRQLSFNNK